MSTSNKIQVFSSTAEARDFLSGGAVVTIGNFDGVHFGHRQIISSLIANAKSRKLKSVVLTFDPHPVKVLSPTVAPKLISTKNQKIELFAELGVDAVVFQKFDADFAKLKPEDFFDIHLVQNLKARFIMVGYDFTFGEKRSGTIETLEALAGKANVDVEIISAKMSDSTLVSSTLIRKLVSEGNVEMAATLLTCPFFIDGKVVHGHKRGTALGIHTANLATENELLPSDGVYATLVEFAGERYDSVANVGFNPTFNNTERSIEAHIFDFDADIYGKDMRLVFVKKLRDEIKFVSPEALVMQIQKDIAEAKRVLKRAGRTQGHG